MIYEKKGNSISHTNIEPVETLSCTNPISGKLLTIYLFLTKKK